MHKPLVTRTLLAALLGTAMLAANASGNATAAEATAMVKKGVAFIKANGKERAMPRSATRVASSTTATCT